jgi:hypothetical protein
MRLSEWSAAALTLAVLCGTAAAEQPEEIERLVQQLGSQKFAEREGASAGLKRIGQPAVEALRRAASSTDPEVRWRARELLGDMGIKLDSPARQEAPMLPRRGGKAFRLAPPPPPPMPMIAPGAAVQVKGLRDTKDADVWRAALTKWRKDPKLGKETVQIMRQIAARWQENLPLFPTADDVEETRLLLMAAIEVKSGKPNK